MQRVAFHTLGCKVNQYDTQAMLEAFQQAGYEPVPFASPADVYVVNTCTVTGTGDKKSMQLIRRVRRQNPACEVIITGCLAQRMGRELLDTGARLVLGTQNRAAVVQLYEQAVSENRQICAVEPLNATPYESLFVTGQQERQRAVLKIQEGCDRHCTYCIIPSVRGPIRSRPLNSVIDEARRLSQAGYREVVLTGIHLTSYGRDLPEDIGLIDVLEGLEALPQVRRVRLGSLEPTLITDGFIQRLQRLQKVCPQYHLALQSGCDTVLARMARRYNMAQYRAAVDRLRSVNPLAAITTDVLTGFPGETEDEFEATCQTVREIGFARLHVFPYSQREGTKAAAMPGQLSKEVKEARALKLIALGEELAQAYHKRLVGTVQEVLLEEEASGLMIGYTPQYVQVGVSGGSAGDIVSVRLTGLNDGLMTGEIVSSL